MSDMTIVACVCKRIRNVGWLKRLLAPCAICILLYTCILTHSFLVQAVDKSAYDIMNMKPIQFSSSFKNPCWYGNGDKNGLFNDHKIHCLPYFYLIGVKKCGTSDLNFRLRYHPQISSSTRKELHWFARIRHVESSTRKLKAQMNKGTDPRNVSYYVGMFDESAKEIEQKVVVKNGAPYHDVIAGDGTPSNLHLNIHWERLPGNEGRREPVYTHFNYIKHLVPKAKLIMIMRDPTPRLWSDYRHTCRGLGKPISPALFHKDASALVSMFKQCLQTNSLRMCTYNNTLREQWLEQGSFISESFTASFYYVFLTDIYKIFPEEQVLTILMSEYIEDMSNVLNRAFKFLEIDPLDEKRRKRVLHTKPRNVNKRVSMLNETQQMLDTFFRPFNDMAAEFMNDSRYRFAAEI